MRAATRLLATAARSSQILEAGAPTGLTGLTTHPAPRSTLLYLYNSTLETLKAFPESSVYRQSIEALTRHRMSIIEATQPAGLSEWQQRVSKLVEQHPEAFRKVPASSAAGGKDYNIVWKAHAAEGVKTMEWDDEYVSKPQLEGPRLPEEREDQGMVMHRDLFEEHSAIPRIEPEPALTLGQIEEVEERIGAGLIEEVIQVAEGEKKLAETLANDKVWEDLEEKPAEGQWTYFERRDTHTPTTQAR